MDQFLATLTFVVVWGIPSAILVRRATSLTVTQQKQYDYDLAIALRSNSPRPSRWAIRTFKQNAECVLFILTALLAIGAGAYAVWYMAGAQRGAYLNPFVAGSIVAGIAGFFTLLFGTILIPDSYADQGDRLVRVREKHRAIRENGWPGTKKS